MFDCSLIISIFAHMCQQNRMELKKTNSFMAYDWHVQHNFYLPSTLFVFLPGTQFVLSTA